MKSLRILVYYLMFFAFLRSPLCAEPVLSHIFSDHMVIQRETEIRIWGWADPGEKISVSLGTGNGQATTDTNGSWRVILPAMRVGGPFALIIQGKKDRKSTRLNSSHSQISYAVFCLKKKIK